jgi:hypothetical protein
VLLESGVTFAYSALYSFTLCTTWSARSGWLASQPESTTATVTPLPVKPFARGIAEPIASADALSKSWIRSSG